MQFTARDIARIVDGELSGNPDEPVTGIAGIREAQPGDVTFVANPRYLGAIKTTQASVILVAKTHTVDSDRTLIRVDNPSLAFATVVDHTAPPPVSYKPGVHPSAIVSATAHLGKDVSIQPFAVLEDGVEIGDRAIIGAGCYIGHESFVGNDCLLYARVTLRERTRLGQRVILHSGVVLGADGFGYEFAQGRHQKIPQIGIVEIGDDVEIGANSAVDRGRFGRTKIGRGTKIDNLVQIGHNCVVGEHCIICGGVGIAGSVTVGNYVTIAGQVGIAGHLTIGDRAVLGAQSGIARDVPPGQTVFGAPAVPQVQFKRTHFLTQRLPELATRLRTLERQLEELRTRLDSQK